MIFGKRLYLALGFNLRDPVGSIKFGSDKATNWYKDKMNKKGATSTAENYYDNPNPFSDFQFSGKWCKHTQKVSLTLEIPMWFQKLKLRS